MFTRILLFASITLFFACKNDKPADATAATAQESAAAPQPETLQFSTEEVQSVKDQCLALHDDLNSSVRAMDAIVSKMPKNEQYKQASDLLEGMQGMAEKTVYLKETAATLQLEPAGAAPSNAALAGSDSAPAVPSDVIQSTTADLKATMESVRETMEAYKKQFESVTGKKLQ